MTRDKLKNILDETEDIYLDGILNGHELIEPVNHIIFKNKELKDIRRAVKNDFTRKQKELNILVEKGDTFNFVIDHYDEFGSRPLVLNFANPCHPGGGVRRGAMAQEEDLCRSSNLLYALESENVAEFYERNKHYGPLGNSNAIYTKDISIIRRTNGSLLDKPVLVDVLTMAAPIRIDFYKYSPVDIYQNNPVYEWALEDRIESILNIADYYGYKDLVLGAFGCGAFRNAPKDVAGVFTAMLHESKYNFESVYFVIKAESERGMKNYEVFKKCLVDRKEDPNGHL